MKKISLVVPVILLVVLILLSLFLLYYTTPSQKTSTVKIMTSNGSLSVTAETAETPEKWAQGLMFRNNLEEGSGMLFIFPDEQQRIFWMKNTQIPLDIIFISANMTIVDIKHDFLPCSKDPCPTYESKSPARYVLEVNAGFTEEKGVEVGNSINVV